MEQLAIAWWNLIQGVLYMIISTIFILYPEIIDILIDSNSSLTRLDYRYTQLMGAPVMVIGFIYIVHGVPYPMQIGLSKLMGPDLAQKIRGVELSFACQSILCRIIFVPIIAIVAMFTFGKDIIVIRTWMTFFIIYDIITATITAFIINKNKSQYILALTFAVRESTNG